MYCGQQQYVIEDNSVRQDSFSTRLKYYLKISGRSQAEFARAVDAYGKPYGLSMSQSTMSAYSRNICQPKGPRVAVIAKVSRLSPRWWYGYGDRNCTFYS